MGHTHLCVPLVKSQAKSLKITADSHAISLIAHSLCHLVGYTHDTNNNFALMKATEDQLLSWLSLRENQEFKAHYWDHKDDDSISVTEVQKKLST